jgi:predicted O-methyltransferase YrrM
VLERLFDPLVRPFGLRVVDEDVARQAKTASKYEYYWRNANKKVDVRYVEGFGKIARRIIDERRTYLYFDRLYTLWQGVAGQLPGEYAVAEVGAYRGGSAHFIADALRHFGLSPRFFVCDTFAGHAEVDTRLDGLHEVGKQFVKTSADAVRKYLAAFENVEVVAGDFVVTSQRIAQHRFGFVHIDVDVYPVGKHCLEFFGARLAPGGVMVVDDYGTLTCPGMKQAVDEFVAANRTFFRLHLLTGQAVLLEIQDRQMP